MAEGADGVGAEAREEVDAVTKLGSKSGKREDLGIYVRSAWEANTARYLNWLKAQGNVSEWAYEPQTFLFGGVKRGPWTYTPDFRVTFVDGRVEWWEVKGWMDPASRGKLKRMAKFYPDIKIVVIDQQAYRDIAKWAAMIPGWETAERAW